MKKTLLLPALLAGSLALGQEPPPPPPPPKMVKPAPPKPPAAPVDDYAAFMSRNKNVINLSWNEDGNTVRIQLKSGKEEVYNLADHNQKQKAETLYGKLPVAPPPPPAPPAPPPPPPPVEQ